MSNEALARIDAALTEQTAISAIMALRVARAEILRLSALIPEPHTDDEEREAIDAVRGWLNGPSGPGFRVLRVLLRMAERHRGPITNERVERICEVMHDAYEEAAVREGWSTQEASRKPWSDVPEPNKRTMRYAVRAALGAAEAVR